MAAPAPSSVAAVRGFNRFYTRQIGALGEHHLDTPFSLTEMRVLYELAHRPTTTAGELASDLAVDPGYLSRILQRFEARGLIARAPAAADRRRTVLRLTARGRRAFAPLERRAGSAVAALLSPLPAAHQRQVVDAMATIERLVSGARRSAGSVTLRAHRPGDMGWVVQRHGELYAREWGYNEEFESLVARIVADFLAHFDEGRERCWIAELDGEPVGSVFLVRKSKSVAKLRLLLVEPQARGHGIGRRLVDACVAFAREAGYRKVTLWTQSELTAARRVYQQAGFRLVRSERHGSFGRKGLVAETWDLEL